MGGLELGGDEVGSGQIHAELTQDEIGGNFAQKVSREENETSGRIMSTNQ